MLGATFTANVHDKEELMEIRQRNVGPTVYLDLTGRLVVTNGDGRLREAVCRLFEAGYRTVILNLEGVSKIDTSGLSTMVTLKQAADRFGAEIKLLNLPARVHDLLVVTRLITLFEVVELEGAREPLLQPRSLPSRLHSTKHCVDRY
jgi:anti-sigma B factor antagonist